MEYAILIVSGVVLLGCIVFWAKMLYTLKKRKQRKAMAEQVPNRHEAQPEKREERVPQHTQVSPNSPNFQKGKTRGLFDSSPHTPSNDVPIPANVTTYSVHVASKKDRQRVLYEGKMSVGDTIYIGANQNGELIFESMPMYSAYATLKAREDSVYIQGINVSVKISVEGAPLTSERRIDSGQTVKLGKTVIILYVLKI